MTTQREQLWWAVGGPTVSLLGALLALWVIPILKPGWNDCPATRHTVNIDGMSLAIPIGFDAKKNDDGSVVIVPAPGK